MTTTNSPEAQPRHIGKWYALLLYTTVALTVGYLAGHLTTLCPSTGLRAANYSWTMYVLYGLLIAYALAMFASEIPARLTQIRERYSNTAGSSATYRVSADDLAWLINEVELHATPRGETTVEAALAELREMFPASAGWYCEISKAQYLGEKSKRIYTRFDVHVTDFKKNDWTEYGPTLDTAMAQVRAATRTEGKERRDEASFSNSHG